MCINWLRLPGVLVVGEVYYVVYAVIRRYKVDTDDSPEALRHALEEFVPHIKKLPGLGRI
jgi:hypothetical protein